MGQPPNNSNVLQSHGLYYACAAVAFVILAWILCLIGGYALSDALALISRKSYQPHHNFMTYIYISGLPLMGYVLMILAGTTLALKLAAGVLGEGLLKPYADVTIFGHLRRATVVALIFLGAMQSMSAAQYWQDSMTLFGNGAGYSNHAIQRTKTMADAMREAVGNRPFKAQLASDRDLTQDPGLLERNIMGFFLYPVDIAGTTPRPHDAWVAFYKRDAVRHVPPGFVVVYQFDAENLIAVRKP